MNPGLAHRAMAVALAASLSVFSWSARSAEPMSQTLCAILKELNPQVKTYKPEGARAQLVMAVAEKYETDAKRLREVRTQIDQLTSSSCPRERDAMLGVTKTKSLSEALS